MNSGRYSNLQKVTLFVDGQDYILPRETVVNWFDREDMQAPVGYFSIRDKIADIKANPQTAVILGKAMAEMQKKTMEKYGDVAKNAQIPEEMQRQMEQMSLEALDVAHTSFGIRMISVDVKNGFMLNGRTLMQAAGKANHNRTVFELTYEQGTLEAVSYTKGMEVSRDRVRSAGKPMSIKITPEQWQLPRQSEQSGKELPAVRAKRKGASGRRTVPCL